MTSSVCCSAIFGLLVTCAAACLSVDGPPTVASDPTGAGMSGPASPSAAPCPADPDAGNFNFDAMPDIGLGIGTTNPTTPADGAAAFSGDATVAPAVDAGKPSPCL